jgi:mannose-6-phosphate isomerase-like protein (cupin superfamily)
VNSQKQTLSIERFMNTNSALGNLRIIRTTDVGGYSPKNHTGTINRRMISRDTVGAKNIEVLIGTIVKGSGAHPHAHPNIEQLGYILTGTGVSVVDGVSRDAAPGRWSILPRGCFHEFQVTSEEPVRVIVVYVPPYHENPDAVTLDQPVEGLGNCNVDLLAPEMPKPTPDKTSLQPIITRSTTGAEKAEVHLVTAHPSGPLHLPGAPSVEQVLYVESGHMEIISGEQTLPADEGDWVFIPAGVSATVTAGDTAGGRAHLIRGSEVNF